MSTRIRGLSAAVLAMALLAVTPPGQAEHPRSAGGGVVTGTMTYVGTPLPKVLSVCEWRLAYSLGEGWTSEAFVFDTEGVTYAGPVTLAGGGGSDTSCESYSLSGGILTMAVKGRNPLTGATLDCRDDYGDRARSMSMTGRYVRVLTHMTLVLTGRCVVNGVDAGQVTFLVEAQAVPTDAANGEGTTRSVRSLTTTSVFNVVVA